MMFGMVLAQAGPDAGPKMFQTFLFLGAIFAVAYFLILRPQKKKEQQRRELLAKVQKNDRVLTIGGIYGEVIAVKEKYVVLNVDSETGTTLKVLRSAVHTIVTDTSTEDEVSK